MNISKHVYAVPVVDRETDLFESLWPLDDGVNYNSYVVVGDDGAAVVDTVHESFFDDYFEKLLEIVDPADIRYVVVNHMEPDHSSSLKLLLNHASRAEVVISQTGANLFKLPGRVRAVSEGDLVDLGGASLQFHMTPWTHWPETMVTHVPEDGVVFTCDLFGAYGAYPSLSAEDWNDYLLEFRRYYVTVLSKYARFVRSAAAKVRALNPTLIAPGHGIVYGGKQIPEILGLYDDWTSNHREGRILILYGSMYGSVHGRVLALVEALESRGLEVDALDLSREDWSYAMTFVLGADAVVVAYPAYDADVFPPVKYFLQTVVGKGLLDGKPIFAIEAHGWASTEAKLHSLLGERLKEFISFSSRQPLSLDVIEGLADRLASIISR